MKRILFVLVAMIMTAGIASAQSLSEAVELFNSARETFENGDKAGAVELFTQALNIASQLNEEGADLLVADCQKNIPLLKLALIKENVVGGNFDQALEAIAPTLETAEAFGQEEVAEELKSLLPKVYVEKGKSLVEGGSLEEAVSAFQQALELDPGNSNTAIRLAQNLSKLDRLEEAKNAYLKAQENGSDVSKQLGNTTLKLASAALKEKKFADAYSLAIEAAGYAENASAYQIAGGAAMQNSKFKDAAAAYEKYIELKGDAPAQIKYNLATCYEKSGNKAKAIEFYKQVTADAKYGKNAAAKIQALGAK